LVLQCPGLWHHVLAGYGYMGFNLCHHSGNGIRADWLTEQNIHTKYLDLITIENVSNFSLPQVFVKHWYQTTRCDVQERINVNPEFKIAKI